MATPMKLTALFTLFAAATAIADPAITPAAQLAPRATDPALVGYISGSRGYADSRRCDSTATLSTSGSYVQCCAIGATAPCVFFTTCSGNTAVAGTVTAACDINTASACNTGIVVPTAGAANGASFIGCWQRSLGTQAFTFVQDIGSASVAPTSSSSSSSSTSRSSGAANTSSSSSRGSSTTTGATTRTTSTSSSPTSNAAVATDIVKGGVVGAVAMLAQILL